MNRRKRMMENLDQDIRDYIERETQDNIERGMPPEEARYAALRKFGNVARVKEDTWEESFVIAALSAVVGLVLAMAATRLLVLPGPQDIPRLSETGVDGRVFEPWVFRCLKGATSPRGII